MELTLLGTGCPQVDPDRRGPANLVRHGGLQLLVDCGSGVTQQLVRAGSRGAALDAVFLTHLHSDHVVDLYQLVISSWHQGRDRPQRVFGPEGTRDFVERTLELWRAEREQRVAHERRASTAALRVDVTEFGGGTVFEQEGLRVAAFEVDHRPWRPSFGFAFEAGGRRVVLSGDTVRCPALLEAARNADVLVQDCFIHREMGAAPGRTEETLRNVASYHALSSDVGRIAAGAAVGCLVLNHFVPTQFDRPALLAEVRAQYAGPVVIGEDLMTVVADTGELRFAGAVLNLGTRMREER
jgi:ribonuclease Z